MHGDVVMRCRHLLPLVLSAATATLATCTGCDYGACGVHVSAHGAAAPGDYDDHRYTKQPKPLGHAWAADVTQAALRRLHRLVSLRGLHWTSGAAPRRCDTSSLCCLSVDNQKQLRLTLLMHTIRQRFKHALPLYLVAEMEMEDPRPLPFQQLTRLQLHDSQMAASDILIVISEMPQLEILEVRDCTNPGFELLAFDAAALSRLPKLRLVDLTRSVLWASTSDHEAVHGDSVLKYLPLRVVQHLVSLQRANPAIEWMLGRDVGR